MRAILLTLCVFTLSCRTYAWNTNEMVYWPEWSVGEWTGTNWLDGSGTPMASPGYPSTNHLAVISSGDVMISTQNVEVLGLHVVGGSALTISNGCSLTVYAACQNQHDPFEPQYTIAHGWLNLWNTNHAAVMNAVFELGDAQGGYLDLGATWGDTSGFPDDFGALYGVRINVRNGGLRVDANSITMLMDTRIATWGQEVTTRGDWLNPDGSTTLALIGAGPGTVSIDGDWSFGGCTLEVTLDTNGVSLIQVGGDATLTDAVIRMSRASGLSEAASSYDLVRVPAAGTISTNGLSLSPASEGGLSGALAVDADRGGYDYLVFFPGDSHPMVNITDPAEELFAETGTNLTITAEASDLDGEIVSVTFHAESDDEDDPLLLGEATTPPYSVVWSNVPGGAYGLYAIATDNDGHQTQSEYVDLYVEGPTADGRNAFITGGVEIIFDDASVQDDE